jgi:hypothetical protein
MLPLVFVNANGFPALNLANHLNLSIHDPIPSQLKLKREQQRQYQSEPQSKPHGQHAETSTASPNKDQFTTPPPNDANANGSLDSNPADQKPPHAP